MWMFPESPRWPPRSLACWHRLGNSDSLGSCSQVQLILMSYIILLVSFVPLVFKRDTAVYLFSRLSNYSVTKLQRGVLMHPAPGSFQHHSGIGLQCLGPIPADLTSPCWPWGSPIHRLFIVKGSDGEMEQLGYSDWNPALCKSGEGMVLKTSSNIHSFIHSFTPSSDINIIRNAIYCKVHVAFKENCFTALNLSTLKYIVSKDTPLLLPAPHNHT